MTSQPTGPDRPLWGPPEGSAQEVQPADNAHSGHAGHKWMMLICCIPMIAIVAVLIVSGTAGSGAMLALGPGLRGDDGRDDVHDARRA